jgi:hypothetical protein
MELGHDYTGTELLLLSLMTGVGGLAEEILADHRTGADAIREAVITQIRASDMNPT